MVVVLLLQEIFKLSAVGRYNDIVQILFRFITYNCVIFINVSKMYRRPDCKQLQQTLRHKTLQANFVYQLTVVCHRTTSTPSLSVELKQLTKENSSQFPEANCLIQNYFCVDELLAWYNELSEPQQIYFIFKLYCHNTRSKLQDVNSISIREKRLS